MSSPSPVRHSVAQLDPARRSRPVRRRTARCRTLQRLARVAVPTLLAAALLGGCDEELQQLSDAAGGFDFDLPSGQQAVSSPTSGPADGGTEVMIYGQDFRADARVMFGSQLARETEFVSNGVLRAVTPPAEPGHVAVAVMHGTGVHVVIEDGFEYTATGALEVAFVSPSRGSVEGGDAVTITGRGFSGDTSVVFGADAAREVQVVNDQVLRVVTPPGREGSTDVTVARSGEPPVVVEDGFAYFTPAMSISSVRPSSGPAAGGIEVRIIGEGFTPQTRVFVGGAQQIATWHSESELSFVAPELAPGRHAVRLVDPARDDVVIEEAWRSVAPPRVEVLGVSPRSGGGGTEVHISGYGFTSATEVLFGGVASAETRLLGTRTLIAVVPTVDRHQTVDLLVEREDGETYRLRGGFELLPTHADDAEPPWLAGATSTGPYSVRIQFSEPVRPSGAADASNYNIVADINEASSLQILEANVDPDDSSVVELVTMPQEEVNYTIIVSGVTDFAGNGIRPADRGNPFNEIDFPGSNETTYRLEAGVDPASLRPWMVDCADGPDVDGDGFPDGDGIPDPIPTDTDCDGVLDTDEQIGAEVEVQGTDGSFSSIAFASNPWVRDTDGDGLSDFEEYANGTNARNPDTDADGFSDLDELTVWLSNPLDQDTDDDGLNEPTEAALLTSFVLADTDGDQFSDFEELVEAGRRPRVADVPRWDIEIGEINLQLDVRYSYTDARGEEVSTSSSFESTMESTEENSFTTAAGIAVSESFDFSLEEKAGTSPEATFTESASVGVETNMSVESTSARSTTNTYNRSVERANTIDTNSEVSREIEAAEISVAVTFRAEGNVAFTIRNLEMTVLQRDPTSRGRSRLVPIATLVPAAEVLGEALERGETAINLGPLVRERGPLIFSNVTIFPQLVEALMKNPESIVVRMTNFDIETEEGRNFAFISEEIAERSSTIIIDYGDGRNETHQIATASRFDPLTGRPVGLNMVEALEAIGYRPWSERHPGQLDLPLFRSDGVQLPNRPEGCPPSLPTLQCPSIQQTFGVGRFSFDGPLQLIRLGDRGGAYNSAGVPVGSGRWWRVIHNDIDLSAGTAFPDITLAPGVTYTLAFTEDKDQDNVLSIIEEAHGASDNSPDTDGDGLSDFLEIFGTEFSLGARRDWVVRLYRDPARSVLADFYQAYSNPGLADSDGDGLSDFVEFADTGTDPREVDTDHDGIDDKTESDGYIGALFFGSTTGGVPCPPEFSSAARCLRFATDPLVRDHDQDGASDGRERRLWTNPTREDADVRRDLDLDGIFDARETTGWVAARCRGGATWTGRSYQSATSFEAIRCAACEETRISISLGIKSGLSGGDVEAFLPICDEPFVRANPELRDSDADGLDDYIEFVLGTNPASADSDQDGLTDFDEWDFRSVPLDAPDETVLAELIADCASLPACTWPADDSPKIGTNPLRADTDFDGLSDSAERIGWVAFDESSRSSRSVTSDPLLADTDGDGLSDAFEFSLSSDPRSLDSDGDGFNDLEEANDSSRSVIEPEMRVDVMLIGYRGPPDPDDAALGILSAANSRSVTFANVASQNTMAGVLSTYATGDQGNCYPANAITTFSESRAPTRRYLMGQDDTLVFWAYIARFHGKSCNWANVMAANSIGGGSDSSLRVSAAQLSESGVAFVPITVRQGSAELGTFEVMVRALDRLPTGGGGAP